MKTDRVLNLPYIRQWADRHGSLLTGRLNDLKLYTALQPIYSLAHKRVVGYEALLRAKSRDEKWISPAPLFSSRKSAVEQIHLDRLCRFLHMNNFLCIEDSLNWLFLNVSPQTIISGKAYGSFFKDLLNTFEFPAHRVVIEVVEQPIDDNELLMETIEYYKNLGCLIAIDDFGAGHSNFDRIWTLKPDIVKLDRSCLVQASDHQNIRDLLSGIVSLIHQAGALVLIEGIETLEQVMIAVESDADFVQGYFFGHPFTRLTPDYERFDAFEILFDRYKASAAMAEYQLQKQVETYDAIFNFTVEKLKSGEAFHRAVGKLLADPRVVRCYRIGTNGIQIGNTVVSQTYQTHTDKRYKPLEDAKSADWFRRHYLRRAVLHPGQLQVTRPYLSITGAHMCVTLSMKFFDGKKESVLCCDLRV